MNNYQQAQMYGGIGGTTPYGYAPQANPNPPKNCQPLTKEEIDSLKQNREGFSLGLTNEERIRSICFHRDEQRRETLRPNVDGTVTCLICGKTFKPCLDLDEVTVQAAVDDILNVLQTTKLLYLDMPEEVAREYYQIIALIEKLPKLYKIASDNFVKHENWNGLRYNYGPSTQQLYNQIAGGFGFGNMGMQPQAMPTTAGYDMGGYQAAGFAPQPMMGQPMMGQPVMPGSNGFGFGGAPVAQGYQPGVQNFQYTPGVAPQPVAPAAAPAPATTDAAAPVVNQKFEK